MEDLWKVKCMEYRIAAIGEQKAYDEIVDRYHTEEAGDAKKDSQGSADQILLLVKE